VRIVSIEPTPNPNSMKLTLDERLPEGVRLSYTRAGQTGAPPYIRALLAIEGVKSVYQVTDFIALERTPNGDWQAILAAAREVLDQAPAQETGTGAAPGAAAGAPGAGATAGLAAGAPGTGATAGVVPGAPGTAAPGPGFGEVQVYVQMIRGIPMQIKLLSGAEEVRVGLPERFGRLAKQVAAASPDFLAERKWHDRGVRYGDMQAIGAEVAEEIAAAYDDERLERLLNQALAAAAGAPVATQALPPAVVQTHLADGDWRKRYAALEQLDLAAEGAEQVLVRALADPNISIRRLAVVSLGMLEDADVLPHLLVALQDPAVAVRRAAGDCLSDLGDPRAMPAMCAALRDPSKLVRWRAARYLYEVGDESVLPALHAAQDDPEFEVRLQVQMAIERITGGGAAQGPAWQVLTRKLVDAGPGATS
jgi:hypothetical protein